jgi:NAD(P)-dependent dehydrogenase (short-subunit alcohol dehydrogenase family)
MDLPRGAEAMTDLPSFDLTGKTALVTGAARGLGRAIALSLANSGADVALGLRDEASGADVAAEIRSMGRRAVILPMNVLNLPEAYAAIDQAVAELGHIDILVNNVGGGTEGPIEDFSEEDFDWTINLTVKSTFFVAQRVARHMISRGKGGTIINMGSQAGFVALPGEGIYCLAKAAVAQMTKCMAIEWGRHNITVNAVAPTFIETDGTAAALGRPEFKAEVLDRIAALHRIGKPKEVSGAVTFLASPAASLITGQTLIIDGGWTSR